MSRSDLRLNAERKDKLLENEPYRFRLGFSWNVLMTIPSKALGQSRVGEHLIQETVAKACAQRAFETEMRALCVASCNRLFEERRPTLLIVTACNHQEGSTTVARELCRSLALDGVKVLLCGVPDSTRASQPRSPRRFASDHRSKNAANSDSNAFFCRHISDLQHEDARNTAPMVFRDWLDGVKNYFEVIVCEAPPLLASTQAGVRIDAQP